MHFSTSLTFVEVALWAELKRTLHFSPDLQPLLQLRSLKVLVLYLSDRLALQDKDIYSMAKAWPELQSIKISCLLASSPTIYSLAAFARHCPNLRDLCLPVTMEHSSPETKTLPALSHRLRRIDLLYRSESIDKPNEIAEFIDHIFPNVEEYRGPGSDNVSAVLALLKRARRAERERLAAVSVWRSSHLS
ncbi:hypothetical protein B0H21DRAFT_63384 [Amylocystis lapponica]|nr:hypothetical protein B0H21DRAFT_63384 [Amylocystis lapponica]